MNLETFPLCLQNCNLSLMGNERHDMRITSRSRFSRNFLCGAFPNISLRPRTLPSGHRWESLKDRTSGGQLFQVLRKPGCWKEWIPEGDFMKSTARPTSFHGSSGLGILEGTNTREGVKNQLDPRNSEPTGLSPQQTNQDLPWANPVLISH